MDAKSPSIITDAWKFQSQPHSLVHAIINDYHISMVDKLIFIRFLVVNMMGFDLENSFDHFGCSPLLFACHRSHPLDMIRTLVELGARVNTQDNDKNNALNTYVASVFVYSRSEEDRLEVVQFLLNAAADVFAENIDGKSALLVATRRRFPQVAKMLEQHIRKLESRTEIDYDLTVSLRRQMYFKKL